MDKPFTLYFVQEGHEGPIKIGVTSRGVSLRVAALQAGNWRRFQLLGVLPVDDRSEETAWHQRHEDARIFGEWFAPTRRLLLEIAEASEAPTICDTVNASLAKVRAA